MCKKAFSLINYGAMIGLSTVPNVNTIEKMNNSHHAFGLDLKEIWKNIPDAIETNYSSFSALEIFNNALSSNTTLPSAFGINLESFIGSAASLLKQSFTVTSVLDDGLSGILTLKLPLLGGQISHPLSLTGFQSIHENLNIVKNSITSKKFISKIKDQNPEEMIQKENLTWNDLGMVEQFPFTSESVAQLKHTPIKKNFLASFVNQDRSVKKMFLKVTDFEATKNYLTLNSVMSLPVYSSTEQKLVPYGEISGKDAALFSHLDEASQKFTFHIAYLS